MFELKLKHALRRFEAGGEDFSRARAMKGLGFSFTPGVGWRFDRPHAGSQPGVRVDVTKDLGEDTYRCSIVLATDGHKIWDNPIDVFDDPIAAATFGRLFAQFRLRDMTGQSDSL
jgi:hypothetical protein